MIGYVYKYTSPSKKSYIGQTRVNIKNEQVKMASDIQKHNTLYPNGYNLTTGGLKSSYSQEVRDKMSKKAKERFLDEDYRRKHSESQKLRFQSPDERYKCGNGNRGKAANYQKNNEERFQQQLLLV